MIESIQQSAKIHNRYQIELKLDYKLGEAGVTRYRTFTYIFLPYSLGISSESYQKNDFYRDIKNYIRIKTPEMSLRDLSDSEVSPFKAIQALLDQPNWYQKPGQRRSVINALKLFGAILKSALRDHVNLIDRRIQEAPPEGKIPPLVENLVEEYLGQAKQISTRYRELYAQFNLHHVSQEIFTAYQLVDEYLSLLLDEHSTEMYAMLEKYFSGDKHVNYLRRLNRLVDKEVAHRVSHGYESILKQNDENESYVYRASVLKKYVGTVLHLDIAAQREGRGLEQIVFALAAGAAMLFATVVAFYFQAIYGNFTFPVLVALVVGYMFKDRIKELGRMILANRLQSALFDRRVNVKSLDGQHRLAVLREKVSYVREAQVPPTILAARNKEHFAELDDEGQGETILCHMKEIILYNDLFAQAYSGFPKVSGLNDIIRYDIYPFLRKMADPVEERLLLEGNVLKTVQMHKVYHVNFVTRYEALSPSHEQVDKRMRLVLSRQGIKRLENVQL